jgi:hypothetical protein
MFFSAKKIGEIVRHIFRRGKKDAGSDGRKNHLHPSGEHTLQFTDTAPQDGNHIFFGI